LAKTDDSNYFLFIKKKIAIFNYINNKNIIQFGHIPNGRSMHTANILNDKLIVFGGEIDG
jgi:hypothetical protein